MKRKNYHFLASCLCGIFAVINITAVPITKASTLPDYSANMYAQTSVVGNNLLEDGDFENATFSWYASSSDNAALLVCTDSDIDHIPSKENCIKITGRTANWNSIVQEISSKVKNNTDYQFSFWVRLSAEYGDETIEVQLCTTKKDSKDPSEVYDTLTMTGGKAIVSSKEWTKIEGTLHVSYSDTLEKLEFKIAEQGAPLSDGTYGSFYVDNAELYELESQVLEIETDIKDLKQQFQEDFGGKAGVAIPDTALENTVRMELVTKHYNSITAENEMKPDAILGLAPSFNDDGSLKLDFSRADKLMDYIKAYNTQHQDNPIYVRGHVLIWHSQTPEWFFHEDYDDAKPYVSKDEMLKRIEYYIKEVTTHFETTYPDMIYAWDVVNEAVDDETGLSILVSVSDSTNDADDSITVYIDETNSKKDGALIKTFSLKREDCTITEQGYQGIITIPLENTFAAKKIGFDLQITNHTQKVSWNDLKHTPNTSSKYYRELILKPFSSILYGTISVDGTLEELWDKAESIPLTIKTNQTDVKANVKAMWDENYLYFYANVIDSCLNKVSADAYQQDSIEIFIDENNHKSDSYENDDSQYRINFENEVSFNGVNCKQENLISKAVLTDDGYFIEAAFKWIEITPREGDKIGLEFQVNDADNSGSRIGTISWFDETGMGWSSPSVFGTVNLVKETSSDDITTTPEPNNPSDDTTTTPEPNNSSNNSSSAISTTPQTQEKEEENQQKENQEEKKENQQENQIGTIIKDVDNKTAYYIIDNKTSEFTGLLSKNKKNVIIPSTVDFNGVSYKITSVAKNALKGNKKVASLTVGSNIKTIGDQAFSDCTTLKNITIEKNTSSIGKKAFYNCKKVNTIIIKTNKLNKNSIGKNAFTKINKNAVIKVPKKKLASYTKLLHKAGVSESVKIISI